ncbi:hypothetical protein DSM21852_33700 [Methylocystis bryophila]|nr:hypothetical protein DSM21852_33700 [Methylocystis bryophila]
MKRAVPQPDESRQQRAREQTGAKNQIWVKRFIDSENWRFWHARSRFARRLTILAYEHECCAPVSA